MKTNDSERPLKDGDFKSSKSSREIPKEVQSMDFFSNLKPYEHEMLDRDELLKIKDETYEPFLPQWIDYTAKPKKMSLFDSPSRKLNHRGLKVNPVHVFNPDDRRIYHDTSYPWGCVCKVVSNRGTGSGVIVGPRHVLTASHCVDWANNGAGTVEVHRSGGFVSAITSITKVYYYTKITGNTVGFSEVDEDYALIITRDRIGDRFGWLGVRTYDSDWDDEPYWYNIGYPKDNGDTIFPIFQKRKELDEDTFDFGPARAMQTNADTMKGQSGGPMFAFWSNGPYVVAVVSSEGKNIWGSRVNYCSGGSLLTKLVRYGRDKVT